MVKILKRSVIVLSAIMAAMVPISVDNAYAEEKELKPVEVTGEFEPVKKLDSEGKPYIDMEIMDLYFDNFYTYSDDTTFTANDLAKNFESGDFVITGLRYMDMKILSQRNKVNNAEVYEKYLYLNDTKDIVNEFGNLEFENNEAYIEPVVVEPGGDTVITLPTAVNSEYGYMWYQLIESPAELYKTVDDEKILYYSSMYGGYVIEEANGRSIAIEDFDVDNEGIYICLELNEDEVPVKFVAAYNVCGESDLELSVREKEVFAYVGDKVTLSVDVKTSKPEDLRFYWKSVNAAGETTYYSYDSYELVFDSIQHTDFGTYTFVASNGYVEKEVSVKITRDPADVDPVVETLKTITTAARGTYALKMSWPKAANATGYVVYKAVGGKWVRMGVTAQTSYLYTNLASGTSYAFAVKPYANYHGRIIYAKTHTSVASFTKPLKPASAYTVARGYTAMKIGWSKSAGATGYAVYKYTGGKYIRVANVKTTTYTFDGLKKGTNYRFAVRPYKIYGGVVAYSDAIAVVNAKTK
ncbi:MAG: hypothetical protein E7262_10110 [Lachnospiraceae bacterium]|nr:hypothetical protein [Lachnospiraceae bacterium]